MLRSILLSLTLCGSLSFGQTIFPNQPIVTVTKDGSIVGYVVEGETAQVLYDNLDVKAVRRPYDYTKLGRNLNCLKSDATATDPVRYTCFFLLQFNATTNKFNGTAGDLRKIR